jgi:hypothetical protein
MHVKLLLICISSDAQQVSLSFCCFCIKERVTCFMFKLTYIVLEHLFAQV